MRAVTPSLLRFALLAVVLAGAPLLGAAAEPAPAGPPLELAKITVTDHRELPPPEAWRYARIPGFEILSAAPDRETQKLLRDFQLFRLAIGVVWPALQAHPPVPVSIILCGTGPQFDAFRPAAASPTDAGQASLFFKDREHAAIILNFGVKKIDLTRVQEEAPVHEAVTAVDDPDAVAPDPSSAPGYLGVDYYQQLYREYVRYLLDFQQPRLPAWLEEGLTQLLMGMKVNRRRIEFATIEDPNRVSLSGGQEDRDFNQVLQRRGLMPLEEFFAVEHGDPRTRNAFADTWAKQAQGLLHLWLYGEGRRYNKPFAQFVARSAREPVTEAMFRECFGMGYIDMLAELRGYIGFTAYQRQEFRARKGESLPEPAPLVLRDATGAEVGRIKGEAQGLAGNHGPAHDELLAPYVREERDARLLAALGLSEIRRGDAGRARRFLEAAAQAQVVHPRAYLELARLRLTEALPATAGDSARLTAAQTAATLQPLLTARRQLPVLPEVYELMAEIWLRSSVHPARPDLAVLNQGVMLFQRRPLLLLRAAELNGKYGDPAEAHLIADYGLNLSRTPEARRAFEEIKAALPPKR